MTKTPVRKKLVTLRFMMDYELFKEIVVENIKEFLPEEFKDYRIKLNMIQKVNQTRECINLIPVEGGAMQTSPNFYVEDMHKLYVQSGDLQEVLKNIAGKMAEAIRNTPDVKKLLDYEKAGEQIILGLVNTGQNREMLRDMPHREFNDLSIVYRWLLEPQKEGNYSIPVNDAVAEQLGMDEEALYTAAVENTRHLLPPAIKGMSEVLREVMINEGMPEEMADMFAGPAPEVDVMYVISNSSRTHGAACILYDEVLQEMAGIIGNDIYILPSSIHEVIAVAADRDPYAYAEMVNDINMTQVDIEERLSNQIYHYDRNLRKLSMATDTPNKQLDGEPVGAARADAERECLAAGERQYR